MNNKPVAWIAVGDNTSVFFDLDCALAIDDNPTPLYTHPHSEESVKVKELTDEEIMELWYPLDLHDEAWVEDSVLVNFARAILRKAQEK